MEFREDGVMPLYDVTCEACGHEVEQLLGREELPSYCPECTGVCIRNGVQGGSTFLLKGSCWEKDGYSRTVGDAAKSNRRQ